MTEFLDAGQFHKNEQTGKWRFVRLGYAKPGKKPGTFQVKLDALPIQGPYGVEIALVPREERQQGGSGGGAPAGGMDDEIPFAPEKR